MAEILKNNSYMALPSSIKRGNPAPLDVTEVWFSYDEMVEYASTNVTAYVGQQMALVDEEKGTATAYIILNAAGDLQEIGSGVLTDDLSIELNDEGALHLHDYGVKYYKYVAAVGTEGQEDYVAAHYEPQEVNEENPWKAGLEPRVVLEGEELVLGWYEPNPTTVEGLNSQIAGVQSSIGGLSNTVNALQNSLDTLSETVDSKAAADSVYTKEEVNATIEGIEESIAEKANANDVYSKNEIDNQLNQKADASAVYTKEEANSAIASAVASVDHLKRMSVASVEAIEAYIEEHDDATQYIFMTPSGLQEDSNRYYEYMVFASTDEDGAVTYSIEKVGNWEVDLADYATKANLKEVSDKTDGISNLVNDLNTALQGEIERATAAEEANITAIETEKGRAEAAEEALSKRIDELDYVGSDDLANTLNQYATKTDLNDYATTESLNNYVTGTSLEEALSGKADKGTTLSEYGITDAYTKNETLQAITDKITEVNGGESAGEVLSQLTTYIAGNDTRVGNIENQLKNLEVGDKNVIDSVEEAEFDLTDKKLSLKAMDASKLINLDKHSVITNIETALNSKVDTTDFNNQMKIVNDELDAIKDIISWKEL